MDLLEECQLHWLVAPRWVEGVINVDVEVGQFSQKAYLPQLDHVSLDKGVSEGGSVVGFKIAELLQEPGDLNDDPEDVFV